MTFQNFIFFQIFIFICGSSILHAAPAILTRNQALKELKEQGFRWRQTESFRQEASSLKDQAHAASSPHAFLIARDSLIRSNLLRFGFADSGPSQLVSFVLVGAEFDYALLDLKSKMRSLAAEANEKAGTATTQQYQLELTYYASLAYLNAQKFQQKLLVQKSLEQTASDILTMATSKLKTGAGIPIDVMRAKGLRGLLQLKQLETKTNLLKAKSDLANLLARDSNDFELEPLKFTPLDRNQIQKETSDLDLIDRPDVRSALQTSEAARNLVEETKAELKPRIALVGDIGIAGDQTLSANQTFPIGSVGVQLTMPLYSGGYYDAKIQENTVKHQKASLQAQQLSLEAKTSISNAREQVLAAEEAVKLSKTQVEISTEELNLARKRFQNGAVGGVETSSAQNSYSSALDNNIEAIFIYEAAKLTYLKQFGTLN
jgi:outer membrane protein TolC